jgi:hypothetical protein
MNSRTGHLFLREAEVWDLSRRTCAKAMCSSANAGQVRSSGSPSPTSCVSHHRISGNAGISPVAVATLARPALLAKAVFGLASPKNAQLSRLLRQEQQKNQALPNAKELLPDCSLARLSITNFVRIHGPRALMGSICRLSMWGIVGGVRLILTSSFGFRAIRVYQGKKLGLQAIAVNNRATLASFCTPRALQKKSSFAVSTRTRMIGRNWPLVLR